MGGEAGGCRGLSGTLIPHARRAPLSMPSPAAPLGVAVIEPAGLALPVATACAAAALDPGDLGAALPAVDVAAIAGTADREGRPAAWADEPQEGLWLRHRRGSTDGSTRGDPGNARIWAAGESCRLQQCSPARGPRRLNLRGPHLNAGPLSLPVTRGRPGAARPPPPRQAEWPWRASPVALRAPSESLQGRNTRRTGTTATSPATPTTRSELRSSWRPFTGRSWARTCPRTS